MPERKPQLHEILAVEGDLKGEKDKIKEEAITTFTKKQNHFQGFIKTLEISKDVPEEERLAEEANGSDRQEIVTTVEEKMKYASKAFIRYWDAKLQKETANQEARADIIVEGVVIKANVPVSFLLAMEEELKQLRKVYDGIPTLQPGKNWVEDSQKGKGYYKSEYPVVRSKTEKVIKYITVAEATKEHPAQVREKPEEITIGRYSTEEWSGMITPAQKSKLLSNVDKILRATKKARQRANNQEITKVTVGKEIFDFINS